MKLIERKGKSTSAVISAFMTEFDLQLEDFKFEVTDRGSSGFLHLFGSKPTKIQFTITEIRDELTTFIKEILDHMNIDFQEIEINESNEVFHINIRKHTDVGLLIGKSAKLLDSLQHLINQMINKKRRKQIKLILDVEGYRERKKQLLIKKAKDIIIKVKKIQKSITLEPLSGAERKIVHRLVETEKELRTMTIGEGEFKRIVIMPKDKFKNKVNKPKPKTRPKRNTYKKKVAN
ncbi:MAG: KH domain-containing protein [Candidatus Cloacimonetes bacterium]|nr:KH domain-containing protein [Candidatus Cloacimonadota bacterium]